MHVFNYYLAYLFHPSSMTKTLKTFQVFAPGPIPPMLSSHWLGLTYSLCRFLIVMDNGKGEIPVRYVPGMKMVFKAELILGL